MAVTRLQRKHKRNIIKAKGKVKKIKRLKAAPVIKKVDVEAIKAEFAKKGAKASAKKEEIKEGTSEIAEAKSAEKPKSKAKKAPSAKKASK